MVRIGIMSFAHVHAPSYASCLKSLENVEFVGVADPVEARGRAAAESFGVRYFPDYDALLGAHPDAVVICSENVNHKDIALAAAKAGCHVLCEKPIATTVEDARAMIDACSRANVKLATAFPVRNAPPILRAREIVRNGDIGKVLAINGTNRGKMPGGWFVDPALAGGGAVMDHTVHVTDLMRWFLDQEVTTVYAEIGTRIYDIPVDDCGVLNMKFSGGVFATLDASWSRPQSFPTWGDVTMEIVGTEGVLYVDAFAQSFIAYDGRQKGVALRHWGDNMDLLMVKSFVKAVEEGGPVFATGEDGMHAMAVALGAYRSSKLGRPVELKEILGQ